MDAKTRNRMRKAWQFHPHFWAPLAVFGGLNFFNTLINPTTGWKAWATWIGIGGMGIGIGYAIIGPFVERRRLSRIAILAAEGFLERNLCPACGYNLRNLTPAPDRCTLCPECGAAWRLPHLPIDQVESNA